MISPWPTGTEPFWGPHTPPTKTGSTLWQLYVTKVILTNHQVLNLFPKSTFHVWVLWARFWWTSLILWKTGNGRTRWRRCSSSSGSAWQHLPIRNCRSPPRALLTEKKWEGKDGGMDWVRAEEWRSRWSWRNGVWGQGLEGVGNESGIWRPWLWKTVPWFWFTENHDYKVGVMRKVSGEDYCGYGPRLLYRWKLMQHTAACEYSALMSIHLSTNTSCFSFVLAFVCSFLSL